jgi:hypothetical protein
LQEFVKILPPELATLVPKSRQSHFGPVENPAVKRRHVKKGGRFSNNPEKRWGTLVSKRQGTSAKPNGQKRRMFHHPFSAKIPQNAGGFG